MGLKKPKILGKEKVHLVITDILLQDMLGTELLAKVKNEYKEIPVIVITGCANRYGPEMAIEVGTGAYTSASPSVRGEES